MHNYITVDSLCRLRLLNLKMVRATVMNIAQRFKELHAVVQNQTPGGATHYGAVSQAAATLVLAEVLQGTTLSVDVSFDQNSPLHAEASVGGGWDKHPVQVEQRS